MMENQVPPGAAPDETQETSATPAETTQSVLEELRVLGARFASAMRAAASTPEAEALKGDLQEGLRDLRGDIDKALQQAKASTGRTAAPAKAADQVRTELASALRTLNRVLERAAETMDRQAAGTDPDEAPPAPPDAPAS